MNILAGIHSRSAALLTHRRGRSRTCRKTRLSARSKMSYSSACSRVSPARWDSNRHQDQSVVWCHTRLSKSCLIVQRVHCRILTMVFGEGLPEAAAKATPHNSTTAANTMRAMVTAAAKSKSILISGWFDQRIQNVLGVYLGCLLQQYFVRK